MAPLRGVLINKLRFRATYQCLILLKTITQNTATIRRTIWIVGCIAWLHAALTYLSLPADTISPYLFADYHLEALNLKIGRLVQTYIEWRNREQW